MLNKGGHTPDRDQEAAMMTDSGEIVTSQLQDGFSDFGKARRSEATQINVNTKHISINTSKYVRNIVWRVHLSGQTGHGWERAPGGM